MTDGTYAGLDDATILERLAGQPQDQPGHNQSGDGSPAADGESGDGGPAAEGGCGGTSHSTPPPHAAASVGSELRARLSTLLGRR